LLATLSLIGVSKMFWTEYGYYKDILHSSGNNDQHSATRKIAGKTKQKLGLTKNPSFYHLIEKRNRKIRHVRVRLIPQYSQHQNYGGFYCADFGTSSYTLLLSFAM
jgi:hypothetical protein